MQPRRPVNLSLGCTAKDRISGFSGIVIAITEWLNGCQRITLAPQSISADGKLLDNQTFDAEQVEVVTLTEFVSTKPHGGPAIAPTRSADPR